MQSEGTAIACGASSAHRGAVLQRLGDDDTFVACVARECGMTANMRKL